MHMNGLCHAELMGVLNPFGAKPVPMMYERQRSQKVSKAYDICYCQTVSFVPFYIFLGIDFSHLSNLHD